MGNWSSRKLVELLTTQPLDHSTTRLLDYSTTRLIMGVDKLGKIFRPKSIAVVGASEKEGSIGSALMRNLIEGGYPGDIYPINPNRPPISGLTAYSSVLALKSSIDLAILAAPIVSTPEIVKECSEAGVQGAIIISAGCWELPV